jgi:deoxyribodipyrimidine photo-lyase
VVLPSEESAAASTSSNSHPKLQFVWGTTMYHRDDLPFDVTCLPDVYTQFRKAWYFYY